MVSEEAEAILIEEESLRRKDRYDRLRELLLVAADDCDERGHAKAISDRFRGAAAICERAAHQPGD